MTTEKFNIELKRKFPIVFSEGLGMCIKAKVEFEVEENATPIFRLRRSVFFMALDPINKELKRLDNSEWASLTVYMKEKNYKICVCADFSTGPNDSLQNYNYLLPIPEEIFTKLNGGKFFSKFDEWDAYLQILVEEEYSKLLSILIKGS